MRCIKEEGSGAVKPFERVILTVDQEGFEDVWKQIREYNFSSLLLLSERYTRLGTNVT